MNSIFGIILSGGMGSRMGMDIPKQFHKINGESILRLTVRRFREWGLFYSLIIVAPAQYLEKTESELSDLLEERDRIVEGGGTRHESTLRGLSAIQTKGDIIVIHDAARPFITSEDLDEVTNGAIEFGAATLAEKISETLVNSSGTTVSQVIDRSNAYAIKTPQAFHSSILQNLLDHTCTEEPTDLCSWLLQINVKTALKISNPLNLKITNPDDLKKAELYEKIFNGHMYGH